MKLLTTQTEMSFQTWPPSRAIVVDAGTGSVTIETWNGAAWILSDTYAVDIVVEYFTQNLELRFTPIGDATVSVDTDRGVKL